MAIDYSKLLKLEETKKAKKTIDYSKLLKLEEKAKTEPTTATITKSVKPVAPQKTFNLNQSLGGGQFNVGKPGELVKTERGYAGIDAPGQHREHIFPIALGGTSNTDNIKVYGKDLGTKKTAYELDIIRQYKAGKLDLPEAQGLVLKKFRELTGIDAPTSMWSPTNLLGGIKSTLPSTTQSIKDIASSVLEEKNRFITPMSPVEAKVSAVKNYAKTIYEIDKDSIQRVKDFFSKTETKSEKVAKGLKAAVGVASVAFSPITALFEAPKDIPALGTLSKIVTLPFAFFGDLGSMEFKQALEVLPINKKTKETLSEAVGEIGALAGQIAGGGKAFKSGKEFLTKKKELVEKFGEKDAETIIKKAEEKATIKPESITEKVPEAPKIDFNKFIPKEEVKAEEFYNKEFLQFSNPGIAMKISQSPENLKLSSQLEGDIKNTNLENMMKSLPKIGTEAQRKQAMQTYVDVFNKKYGTNYTPIDIAQGKHTNMRNDWMQEKYKKDATDIWNKTQETPAKLNKPSGVAINIEAKAIEQGMLKKGYKELAEYDSSTIKEQADLASRYDVKELNKIARGDAPLPRELKPGTVLSIAEDYAKNNQDINLMRDLARSPLVSRISESASEVSLSRMREKGTTIDAMREIIKARQESYKAKTGREYIKDEVAEVKKIKEEIKKSLPKKNEWIDFLSEITCK